MSLTKLVVAPLWHTKKTQKKARPEPTVHHDLDSWLQHVDNLKKELELLKGKLADKKKPDVTKPKPEEPKKKAPTPKKPKEEKDNDDAVDADERGDSESDEIKDNGAKDKAKPDRVLPPVAGRGVDFGDKPVPEHPVPGNRKRGTKPSSQDASGAFSRQPRGVHGD